MKALIEERLKWDHILRVDFEKGISQVESECRQLKLIYREVFDEESTKQEKTQEFLITVKKCI